MLFGTVELAALYPTAMVGLWFVPLGMYMRMDTDIDIEIDRYSKYRHHIMPYAISSLPYIPIDVYINKKPMCMV
jgi:hypothetical protein